MAIYYCKAFLLQKQDQCKAMNLGEKKGERVSRAQVAPALLTLLLRNEIENLVAMEPRCKSDLPRVLPV